MEEIGSWRVERVIANEGDVHAYAVVKDGTQAVMHIVAPGASSTLLHGATLQRQILVRGKHEGRAFVVTTEPRAKPRRKSFVLPLLVLVLALAGGVLALVLWRSDAPACTDCVLIVDGAPVSSAAYRMYASDPNVLPGHANKQRAALDLLIVRSVLHAEAAKRGVEITDVAERARDGDFALGLRAFDLRAKLAADGEAFTAATIDRYAKAVGLASRDALFEEMRIERMAIEVGGDHAAACRRAKVVVVKVLDPPFQPCSTL